MFLSIPGPGHWLLQLALLPLILVPAPGPQAGQQAQSWPQLPELDGVPRPPELWASGFTSATIHRFDPVTGAPLGDLGNVPGAQSVRRGPDGLLYACAEATDRVLRFDADGNFIDAFVLDDPLTPQNETGGLNGPTAAVFGPDDNLYVASFNNDRVLLYDGSSGAFLGIFADFNSGLSRPRDLRFRDGLVYVTSWGSNEILRYDFAGNFVDVFAVTNRPTGMAFGPHDGDLYVTSDTNSYIKRLDGQTGLLISKPVANNSGVLDAGVYLHFQH